MKRDSWCHVGCSTVWSGRDISLWRSLVPTCFALMEAEGFSRTEVVFYQATLCWMLESSLHENAGHHKMQEVPLSEACHPQRAVVKDFLGMCGVTLMRGDTLSLLWLE